VFWSEADENAVSGTPLFEKKETVPVTPPVKDQKAFEKPRVENTTEFDPERVAVWTTSAAGVESVTLAKAVPDTTSAAMAAQCLILRVYQGAVE
jgi:hypothetical protein